MRFLSAILALSACGALVAVDAPAFHIPNGDMTRGEEIPAEWGKVWIGSGVLKVSRDTETFHSAPASLLLATTGAARGNTSTGITMNGAHAINISGWLRGEGTISASIYAECYDDQGKQIGFYPLSWTPVVDPTTWTMWQGQLNTPAGTTTISLAVMVEGTGKVWLDDVRDIREPEFPLK